MHWGSGWGARFDAKGHGVADCSHPVKGFASGFATLDCLLPICCTATKASMTGHACLQSTSYFFPALTLLTFWVTFCVTFHLTNTASVGIVKNNSCFTASEALKLYISAIVLYGRFRNTQNCIVFDLKCDARNIFRAFPVIKNPRT